MKYKLFLIMLCANSPCFAVGSNIAMPDGSHDSYFGIGAVSRPNTSAYSDSPGVLLAPIFRAQWSNGIFVSGFDEVGMHLSDTPGLEYGPLLHWRDYKGLRGIDEMEASPNVGVFFNYDLGHDYRIKSTLVTTVDAPGWLLQMDIRKTLPSFAAHHIVWLKVGATFADSSYASHHYSMADSTATGSATQNYAPSGGLLDVHAALTWDWALSPRWLVETNVMATFFSPMVADSPVVNGNRSSVSIGSGLAYRF